MRAGALLLVLAGCGAEWHSKRGREALDAHELSVAEGHFRRALGSDPTHLDALAGLGWTYQLAGQPDAAASSFERCLSLDPQQVECLRGSAAVALGQGNAARARSLLDQARAEAPDDVGVLTSLGLLQSATGDLDAASATWETLVARLPERPELRAGLADTRLRQGRVEEAVTLADQGLLLADAEPTAERHRAALLLIRARARVAATADRVDAASCDQTAPPVLAWLDAADADLDSARSRGVDSAELGAVDRLVQRRRAAVVELCGEQPAALDPALGGSGSR